MELSIFYSRIGCSTCELKGSPCWTMAALLPSTWLPLPLSFGVMPNPKGASWLRTFEGETDYDDDEEEEEEEGEIEEEEEEEE
ncbi:hypothetical protein HZH66_014848 [Vespula vulgaris]|uniref:Uncharacterized protein n=1 Tax=Vespula vulgaris TaxID=7454 RepID=A0A834J0B7_VESVU|nr:hypothetical protein HZH66_014848 [Vespula vulgaris]